MCKGDTSGSKSSMAKKTSSKGPRDPTGVDKVRLHLVFFHFATIAIPYFNVGNGNTRFLREI